MEKRESERDTVVFVVCDVALNAFQVCEIVRQRVYLQMHYSISKQMIFDEEMCEREKERQRGRVKRTKLFALISFY